MPVKKTLKSKKANQLVPAVLIAISALILALVYARIARVKQQMKTPSSQTTVQIQESSNLIDLPRPQLSSRTSVEAALQSRRSIRAYSDQSLSLAQISQMLWAAQGVTTDWGGRTAPSAKSVYPLSLYLVVDKVDDLDPGVYKYIPEEDTLVHKLSPVVEEDVHDALTQAAIQNSIVDAPAVVIITGDFAKMTQAFDGQEANSNVYLEAGHTAQNMYLQAESLGLGMVVVGGFDYDLMRQVILAPGNETLIYAVPFGYPDTSQ